MKIGAIIQARMTSTRLPGKVASELPYGSGITVLEQVVRRLNKCDVVDEVIVATTTDKADDGVVRLAKKAGAKAFRGSREDVLSRYFAAAAKYKLDAVVRITSDCPCADPVLIEKIIRRHLATGADYTANTVKQTYPDGFDVEVFSFKALESCNERAVLPPEREHVTFYMRSHPEMFRVGSYEAPKGKRRPELRVTLDTPADYALLCSVYDALYRADKYFGWKAVLKLFSDKPWLETINMQSLAKKVFKDKREEFEEAVKLLTLQEMPRAVALIERASRK